MYEVNKHDGAWGVFKDGALLQVTDTEDNAHLIAARYELIDEHLVPGWKKVVTPCAR